MLISVIPLVLLTALLNTAAQLMLKMGMSKIGEFTFSFQNILPIGMKILSSPFVILGLFIYVVSVMLWLLVLSRTPVNIAYPLTSLGYVFNAIGAYFIFQEQLSYLQMAGIVSIILGVYLLAQH